MNFVQGFDVSHHNGLVDFGALTARGNRFCFVKATQGTEYIDPMFKRNWSESVSAGLMVGAYHFFEPSKSAKDQAEHFLKTVGQKRVGDLPCVLDFEQSDNMRVSIQKSRASEFLEIVEKETGRTPIFYSYRSFIQNLGYLFYFERFPLWLALYNSEVVMPKTPAPWSKFTFWQYSDGHHEGTNLDLNYFNGTLAELKQFAGLQP